MPVSDRSDNPAAAVVVSSPGPHSATVIWLHGLGADGHDFEPIVPELGLPRGHGIKFIFPHAPERPVTINGGMVMRAWYDVAAPDLTQREDEAGLQDSADHVRGFIAAELERGIPSRRIVLAGFSQGGAIALFAGLRFAEPLAGILALSSYLPVPSRLAHEASTSNKDTPILMAHGLLDPIIPVHQGEISAGLLRQQTYAVEWKTYPMPHSVCPAEIHDIGQWVRQRLP